MFISSGLDSFIQLCSVPCFSCIAGPDYAHQCYCRTTHTLGQTAAEEHQHKPWERKRIGAVGAGDRLTNLDGECALLLSYITIVLCSLHMPLCLLLFCVVLPQRFPFCRFKVEVYLLKPSASRLHLLQQAQIFRGPEKLSDMSPSAVWGIVSFWTVWIHFYWWGHVCILTDIHPHPKRVLIDSFFIHFILDSPQYLGHLLSSPLCRADWGAGCNLKEGGRTYWGSYGEAHVGGAERWPHWDLCEEHSVSPQ